MTDIATSNVINVSIDPVSSDVNNVNDVNNDIVNKANIDVNIANAANAATTATTANTVNTPTVTNVTTVTNGQIVTTNIITNGESAPDASDKVMEKFCKSFIYKCLLAARDDYDNETSTNCYPKFQTYDEYTNDTNNDNPLVKNIQTNVGTFLASILAMMIKELLHEDLVNNPNYLQELNSNNSKDNNAITKRDKIKIVCDAVDAAIYPNVISEIANFNDQSTNLKYLNANAQYKKLLNCDDRKGFVKAYIEQSFKSVYNKPYYADLVNITTELFTNFIKVIAAKHYRNMIFNSPAFTMNYVAGILNSSNFNSDIITDNIYVPEKKVKSVKKDK